MLDAETVAIIFMVVGGILIMVEAFSPGVFILIPGTVLVILGIVGFFYPDFLFSVYSPVLAIAVAIPVTVGTIKLYQFLGTPELPTTVITESLIGKEGVVTAKTGSDSLRGKVRIDSEIWSAKSSEPIEVGTPVKVIKAEGIHVTVSKK